MTMQEFLLKDETPYRNLTPPDSILEAKDKSGKPRLLCMADLIPEVFKDTQAKFPDILEWEVTKEHFTKEEYEIRCQLQT